jgi:hypothetical protein
MKIKVAFLTTKDSKGAVGIGDCTVITFDEKFDEGEERKGCIVIDGGYAKTNTTLKNYLNDEGIKVIDLMVGTHIDNDHISGLNSFLESYVIKKKTFELRNFWGPAPKGYEPISLAEFASYMPEVSGFGIRELTFISQSVDENEELYRNVKDILGEGNIWHPSVRERGYIPEVFKSVKIDILAPDKQIPDEEIKGKGLAEVDLGAILSSDLEIDLTSEKMKSKVNEASLENNRTANNQSLVLKLIPLDENRHEIEKCTLLFTGDAEKESWEFMVNKWGKKLESKLLKVAHHGSRTGTSEQVLNKVKPKYCIICAGKNSHGLPDEDVLKMIDKKNYKIFCTGRNSNKDKSPCINDNILDKCARCDENKKDIKDPVIFEVDTSTKKLSTLGKFCAFAWRNISSP